MGLINDDPKTYVGTFQGRFTTKAQEGEEGAKSRVNKNNKIVWYKEYQAIEGFVIGAERKEREWEGNKIVNLNITLLDDGMEYIISLSWYSNLAFCFLNAMQNIDFNKRLRVEISSYNDRGYLFFKQSGFKVEPKYTKENPGNKPPWEKKTFNGEEKWDRTKELAFFESILNTEIKPRLANPFLADDSGTITAETPVAATQDDDMPF